MNTLQEMGKTIRRLREAKELSQTELAQLVGYKDKTSIAKIEAGKVDLPQSKIKAFANALGTTPSYLFATEQSKGASAKAVRIPVLSEIPCGIPEEAIEFVDEDDWEEISEQLASTGKFYALRAKGDSMSPRIQAGDVLIIRVQPDADSGDIVIAKVNGYDACCKRLIKQEGGGITLQSFNPAYDPMYYTEQQIKDLPVTIQGKVIENRQKF